MKKFKNLTKSEMKNILGGQEDQNACGGIGAGCSVGLKTCCKDLSCQNIPNVGWQCLEAD